MEEENEFDFPRTRDLSQSGRKKPIDGRKKESIDNDKFIANYIKHASRGQLYIPVEKIPDGMQYGMLAQAVRGHPITSFSQKGNLGWTEVPQERHPDIPTRVNDHVLCERPIEIKERIDEHEEQQQRLITESYKKTNMVFEGVHITGSNVTQYNNPLQNYYQKKIPGQY